MTEHAEIERLLQKTGRTLEGLPGDYGDEKLRVWNSFLDKTWGYPKSFEMVNRILHQSDVIELLIGALQDSEPVVRCKDCIHRHESEFCECRDDDAFCSDGERQPT